MLPGPSPPAYTAMSNPVVVVSPDYSSPNPVNLTMVKKLLNVSDAHFAVTDVNGTLIFKIKGAVLNFRERRILVDAAGTPVASLKSKLLTAHKRWQVFRGDSVDPEDLLFSARMAHMFQDRTEFDVFLAGNTTEDLCDFKIIGSWLERSCTVLTGNGSAVLARMDRKNGAQSVVMGKDSFLVTVNPHVDYAFIVALMAILNEHEGSVDD
ncbi:Protein LURP-one-related like [Quillaja saponaria]|uniref:Protein LURP-one-related like n=1 Tax=Quillaja saponaria TaxID=32244 RepID=A0AAD7L2A7_QUISA|nr:Protein LURP-one-related like [Quillaja saponaria]